MIPPHSSARHGFTLTELLGDGSVQQVTGGRLNEQFWDALTATGHTNDVWVVP